MPAYNPGALVLYHAKSAVVTAVNREKLEIRLEGGDTKSVRPKDIEFLHPGPVHSLPPAALPAPDAAELVALLEGETLPFGDFAELACGDRSAEAFYSAWQLLQEGIYFTGSLETGVTARSSREIETTLAALRAKEAKQLRRTQLLDRIRSGELLPEDLPFLREIEQVARGETASSRLLRDLGIEAVPPKAHELLLKLGVWDLFVDPWPARMGVELASPAIELGRLPAEPRTDLTHFAALAIDDEGSNDPDDAISYEDGLLWVHVADPATLVAPGTPADDEAMNRGENLYLPEKIAPMLPEEATTLFGLGLQPESPAISFAIRIAEDGIATLEKLELAMVRVERLTYESAKARWNDSPLRELRPMLERFKARRKHDGALFIDLPEVKIKVEAKEVKITPIAITPERELVANAMLAAGSAVAKYAAEQGFPLPFATQVPPEPEEATTSQTGIAAMFALRRSCPPSVVNTFAAPHAGLGLACYARVTSPLRRYGDLLAHQQLRRVIRGEEPLSAEYLEARLAVSEREALMRRHLERQANEFWTQVFLAQHPGYRTEAIPVLRQDDRLTWLIPELAYEFKNRFGGKLPLGKPVSVQLTRSDPAAGSANFHIL